LFLKIKRAGKGKVAPEIKFHIMMYVVLNQVSLLEDIWGSEGIPPCILALALDRNEF